MAMEKTARAESPNEKEMALRASVTSTEGVVVPERTAEGACAVAGSEPAIMALPHKYFTIYIIVLFINIDKQYSTCVS